MWLSDLAIRQPFLIVMLVVAVVVVGIASYARMPVDLLPNVEFPVVLVQASYPGASPEEVERSVTKPLEDAVASVSGVDKIRSTSSDSFASITVRFVESRSSKEAAADVSARVNAIRGTLPSDVQDPVVQRFDFTSVPVLSFAVTDPTGSRTQQELRALVDNSLRPRLERIPDVGNVTVTGGRVRQIDVALKLDRLQALGIAAQSVVGAIKGENASVPGGRVVANGGESHVVTTGQFTSVAQIGDVVVPSGNGAAIPLRSIADVTDNTAEVRQISRLNGAESVVLTIQKRSGTNSVSVANRLKDEVAHIRQDYPELTIASVEDPSSFVEGMLGDIQRSLILGAILAALVVLFFFRDLRSTLVTVAGLPVVILGTFAILNLLGISLNEVSMLALSLCIGLLVDDAIVVRENIFRRIERGENPLSASQRGTAEIALAVVAVSTTIVAVFLPIGFVGGTVGKFLRDFGITVSVAVLVSLLEAFTLAPMLSAYFFHPSTSAASARRFRLPFRVPLPRIPRFSDAPYRRVLGFALTHRPLTVGIGFALFVLSLFAIPLLPKAFVAESDYGFFLVSLNLPPGTSLLETDRVAGALEDVLRTYPQIDHFASTIGTTGPESASIEVVMTKPGETKRVVAELRPKLAAAAGPVARVSTDLSGNGGGGDVRSRPIQISVKGDNGADLEAVSVALVERVAKIDGATDVARSVIQANPSRSITIDRSRTAALGVSAAQVGVAVRTLVNGETATTYRVGDQAYDIVVRLRPQDLADAAGLGRLPIATATGSLVPLSSLANIAAVQEPTTIERTDRKREIVVGAAATGRDQSAVSTDIARVMADLRASAPPGITMEFAGQVQQQNESFASLFSALGLSILFVYLLLAIQFVNPVHPFTIMIALPLSIVGALVALLIAHQTFDILAMIGIILLLGLVTKNSILLVDFANRRMRAGATAREAMLDAGPTRLRPILMTTGAMVLGMFPAAAGLGAGSEFRQPMGTAVIGGLLTSTVLTLVIVPVIYTWIDALTRFVKRVVVRTPSRAEPSAVGSEAS